MKNIEIMDWIAYVQVEKNYEQKQSAFYGRWDDQHEDECCHSDGSILEHIDQYSPQLKREKIGTAKISLKILVYQAPIGSEFRF